MNMLAPIRARVSVEIVYDFVCPWCYVGITRLLATLKERPEIDIALSWRPFLLNPGAPRTGIRMGEYIIGKHGSEERAQRLFQMITELGRNNRITFRFDRIRRVPPTQEAHRLVAWAAMRGDAEALVLAIYAAHFEHGLNIAEPVTLVEIAAECGFDRIAASDFLQGQTLSGTIAAEYVKVQKQGVNGVPSVLINQFALTGVHEPQVFHRLLDVAVMDTAPGGAASQQQQAWTSPVSG